MENELIKKEVYNNLPKLLKTITSPFEGREKDIVLLSTIGVLSTCLPKVSGIYDGDLVYPNLYVLIIAPPASGKGVMNYSRILIHKIHDKIFQDSKNKREKCINEAKIDESKSTKDCPQIKVKIIPANISTSEMYAYMSRANHGVLIIESEADTLSNMLKNDWSNYSDVLRKAFHHESLSVSRKTDNLYLEINNPKLSLVVSGTPNQLQPLIKSKENGLFSRFLVYSFDEISEFKNVFEINKNNYKDVFSNCSDEVFTIYDTLISRNTELSIKLTETQSRVFFKEFSRLRSMILEKHPQDIISNLNRLGLITFRICMILTILRNRDNLKTHDEIYCTNKDFIISLRIVRTILTHIILTHSTIEDGVLSELDEEILFSLKQEFTRIEAIEVGAELNVPKRTVDDKLRQWQKKKAIKKIAKGLYRRLNM